MKSKPNRTRSWRSAPRHDATSAQAAQVGQRDPRADRLVVAGAAADGLAAGAALAGARAGGRRFARAGDLGPVRVSQLGAAAGRVKDKPGVNTVEQLQGVVASQSRRLARLEELFASRLALKPDEREASALGEKLGLGKDVLFLPATSLDLDNEASRKKAGARRDLARALRERGWTVLRIARVFYCGEKTARRWLS